MPTSVTPASRRPHCTATGEWLFIRMAMLTRVTRRHSLNDFGHDFAKSDLRGQSKQSVSAVPPGGPCVIYVIAAYGQAAGSDAE
jgi:hypothetical protein